MHSSADLSLDSPLKAGTAGNEAVVQDRPTLGSLADTSRGIARWLAPAIDLLAASLALLAIAAISGVALVPALPVAFLLLVAVSGALGLYGRSSNGLLGAENGAAWPVLRMLVAAL